MKKGDFDKLYDLYRVYELTPEIVKENMEPILSFHSNSSPFDSFNKTDSTKFSKYFKSKTEQKVSKKGTQKKSKVSETISVSVADDFIDDDDEEEEYDDEFDFDV